MTNKIESTKGALLESGKRFTYKGIDFIALGEEQGGLLAVAAELLPKEYPFDKDGCGDWRKSSLRKYLNGAFLKNIGKNDLLPFISDLTADDGDKAYGTSEDYVFLLSCDLYRKYRSVMPKYNNWAWTLTAWSPSAYSCRVRRVYTSGALSNHLAYDARGAAPACLFNPKIFE